MAALLRKYFVHAGMEVDDDLIAHSLFTALKPDSKFEDFIALGIKPDELLLQTIPHFRKGKERPKMSLKE